MSETNSQTAPKKGKGKLIAAICALVVLVGLFITMWAVFGPKTTEGAKEVSLSVVDDAGKTTTYETNTDALVLKEVMDELADDGLTYGGSESEYGLMIDTVNGLRADYTLDGAYWSFYVNDEYCNYGISEQPVNDGDTFSIIYTPAQ